MPRCRSQFRVRNPNLFLRLSLLARPHRHARILRTNPVDRSGLSAHASRLAPRAARLGKVTRRSRPKRCGPLAPDHDLHYALAVSINSKANQDSDKEPRWLALIAMLATGLV